MKTLSLYKVEFGCLVRHVAARNFKEAVAKAHRMPKSRLVPSAYTPTFRHWLGFIRKP